MSDKGGEAKVGVRREGARGAVRLAVEGKSVGVQKAPHLRAQLGRVAVNSASAALCTGRNCPGKGGGPDR